jgi:SAM-dependent methyltransferase
MTNEASRRVLFEGAAYPVFQNRMYDSLEAAQACPTGDIRLVENLETGLVYNEAFDPELLKYDSNYQNEQATSEFFQEHLRDMSSVIRRTMGNEELVEVGCGKGFFLEMLLEQGIDVTGFDPTYEGSNPMVEKRLFDPSAGIQARGLILRHVLEHIQDPVSFLGLLSETNGGAGRIYIEVPCFDWICENNAWFDVFYEHVNYFRTSDFLRIFGEVIESGKVFGGQYMYVVAELASLRTPVIDAQARVLFPEDFLCGVQQDGAAIRERSAVWGGASKGVIFALLKSRAGHAPDTIIDINPAKQGRHIAVTGLRVRAPQEALPDLPKGSTIYIMNSNYQEEIESMSGHAYKYVAVDKH